MSVFKLPGTAIQANTITTTQLQTTVVTQIQAGGGPKVKSLIYPGNDSAANSTGGQTVYITGSGFAANAQVLVNGSAVPSQSFISASNISFTTPALSTGTYPVYIINPEDGGTAILYPGLLVSGEPSWVTSAGSLSASQDETSSWSYSLSATGDAPITYALAAGNTLPTGVSLAANGLISGTITSPSGTVTTYTFSVVATDTQNQDSTRQFTVTTTTGEGVLFANNVLLIHADGTNNGNNHAFVDSSNNNFTITRNGNSTQGTFSPFSQTGWSAYFDGTGDYLSIANNAALQMGSGNFTIEYWWYPNNITGYQTPYDKGYTNAGGLVLQTGNGDGRIIVYANGSAVVTSNTAVVPNSWTHMALVRNGTNLTLYQNGISVGSATNSTNFNDANTTGIGANIVGSTQYPINGYLSNFRIVKGTALYTSGFTPPTTPLTAVANTSLLTCQSNRFVDESPNRFTITRNGDASIQSFSPFAPGIVTANSHSAYFDGSGDYLSYNPLTSLSSIGTGPVTIEAWLYYRGNPATSYEDIFIVDGKGMLINNGKLRFYGLSASAAPSNLTQNVWVHVAVVRESNSNLKGYIDGSEVFSTTSATSFGGAANTTGYIGTWAGGTEFFTGYISNLRVSNSARYTANFTPSTIAFTSDANTALLICQSPTIIDNSNNNFTLTRSGDVFTSKSNPFGQNYTTQAYSTANVGGSTYFDGSGDWLSFGAQSAFDCGTSTQFCMETWVYPPAAFPNGMHFWSAHSAGTADGFYFTSSGLYVYSGGGGGTGVTSSKSPTIGSWNHCVLTRDSGGRLRYFINGELTGTSTTTVQVNTDGRAVGISGGVNFVGDACYQSQSRFIKGSIPTTYQTSSTTANAQIFIPPTAPLTTTSQGAVSANVIALVNATNAQIFDQTAKNVLECVGDAKVSTSVYKYGTASMYFDGTGDRLHTGPSNPLLSLGTGDFTVECWVNKSDTNHRGIWQISSTAGGLQSANYTQTLALGYQTGVWQIYRGNGQSESASYSITPNTWYHTAVVRNSGTTKLYVNGTEVISVADTNNYTGTYMVIGGYYDTNYLHYGYIDDLRITKGYARYTSNFTPPTSALKDK